MKSLTDAEVIESVLKGNAADYAILVDRYKNKAFSLLKRMLKNDQEAEEVLQDSFLKAFNNLKSFRQDAKFSTWFYKIVYNTALTRLSNKKRKIESEMSSIEDYHHLESDTSFGKKSEDDLKILVKKLVESLPEKNAAVVTMFYLEEMSCEEISNVMQISVSNVKVLLHRSRNLLKEIIEKEKIFVDVL